MDLNHRPHAYQACALDQLSYRPGSLILPMLPRVAFQRTGLGPVPGNWVASATGDAERILESAPPDPEGSGADLRLVA